MEPWPVSMGHKQLFGPNASGKAGVPCNDNGYLCINAHNACWILHFSKTGLWIYGPHGTSSDSYYAYRSVL